VYAKIGVIRKKLFFLPLIALLLVATSASTDFATGLAAYKRGDYKNAFRKFEKLAEQGNPLAQNELGIMYEKGKGVPQDYTQAVQSPYHQSGVGQGGARVG